MSNKHTLFWQAGQIMIQAGDKSHLPTLSSQRKINKQVKNQDTHCIRLDNSEMAS